LHPQRSSGKRPEQLPKGMKFAIAPGDGPLYICVIPNKLS